MSTFGKCPVCEKWVLAIGDESSIAVIQHTANYSETCGGSGCRPTHKSYSSRPPARYLGRGMWRFTNISYPQGVPVPRLDGGDPARSKAEPERSQPISRKGVR